MDTEEQQKESAELLETAEVNWGCWGQVIVDAIAEMSTKPEQAEQLVKREFLDDFLDNLRESLERKILLANYLQYTDPIYLEIKKNAEKIRQTEPHTESAFEKAWEERKYLLKRFIRQNLDTIQQRCFDDNDGDNNSNQSADDSGGVTGHDVQESFIRKMLKRQLQYR